MSATKLPGPIAAYFEGANTQNAQAVAACFDEDAVVRDEGRERHGVAAIRGWAEEVSAKYHPVVDVLDVAEGDSRTIVTGRVSGDFPGSPVDLRYAFAVQGQKIGRLEIT